MICKQCGAAMAEGQRFCTKCGAPVAAASPAAADTVPIRSPRSMLPPTRRLSATSMDAYSLFRPLPWSMTTLPPSSRVSVMLSTRPPYAAVTDVPAGALKSTPVCRL